MHCHRNRLNALSPQPPPGKKPTKEASIAIEVAGIVVRVEAGVTPGWLADVLRAAKAA